MSPDNYIENPETVIYTVFLITTNGCPCYDGVSKTVWILLQVRQGNYSEKMFIKNFKYFTADCEWEMF
ncbi:hypothetical protein FF38_02636 [Lucilia cuprina]|uniref:Uncharacterized protein n=1 Tax=Lucilia cuprina TaxID=7375 RepID=A0A0L0C4P2_LUCCU|nr:hypothetical protein FF38_02636 [Lucilia cuprina]